MDIFTIQLLASFFVGGGVITALSFIVERIDKKYAGLILASPTTTVLGLFFLGLTIGSDKITTIIPATFLPLGISILFAAIYFYSANYLHRFYLKKMSEILLTYTLSIFVWLLLILPIILLRFSNLIWGIAACFALIGLTQYLLSLFPFKVATPKIVTYTFAQKLGRGIFIGLVITLIVYLGKTLGPFWGGVFSVFPGAFSSTLPIFHWYNEPKDLYAFVKGIPLGALSVIIYLVTALFTFPVFGYGWGTVAAYIVSLSYIVVVSRFQNRI